MIKITRGLVTYTQGGRHFSARVGDVIDIDDATEARWVADGVARYVGDAVNDQSAVGEMVEPPAADNEAVDNGEATSDAGDAGDAETTGDAEAVDYENWSDAELRAECKAHGIKYGKRATRDQLVDLLKANDKPPTFDEPGVDS